jgi:threonylcarbamoyladenosine tRNA methylthiotransferase MtaB
MPNQVPPPVRQERMSRLLALARQLADGFHASQAGATRPVLWESERDTPAGRRWFGHTDNYVPVYAAGEALANRITPARLLEPFADGLFAQPVGVAA